MATTITNDCISCGACEPECPNNAISQADPIYIINPQLCTECVGFHDYEACAAVCPVDCCVTDPQNIESESVLIERARALHKETDFGANFPSRFRKGDAEQKAALAVESAAVQAPADSSASETQTALARAATEQRATTAAAEPAVKPAGAPANLDAKAAPLPEAGALASAAKTQVEPAAKASASSPAAEQKAAPAPRPTAPVAVKVPPAQAGAKLAAPAKPRKTFAKELPGSFEELSNRYTGSGSLSKGIGKIIVIVSQPLLGALPHDTKKRLESAVQSPLFTVAGSTGLNIVQNAVLYPLICMAVAAVAHGPAILFSQAINSYVLLGLLLAAAEGVYRLRDGIFSPNAADEMIFRGAVYGAPLAVLLKPVLEKQTGLIRDLPIPVDGFYSQGFVDKLERERRYGNVYTVQDRGGALLLRMEFPRIMPDAGLSITPESPRAMPDYDYDLTLNDGEFIVKGRCVDEQVRKVSSSAGAFPPEFTTVIPLREKITGFAHRFENKLLEVLLTKDTVGRWSQDHR